MEPLEALQLGLFGEAVPAGTKQPGGRPNHRTPSEALDAGGQFQSFKRNNQDALAAVTVLFHRGEPTSRDAIREARKLLTGQAVGDLREVALAASFIAAMCLRMLDIQDDGVGFDLLEELGLTLAQHADSPVGYFHEGQ